MVYYTPCPSSPFIPKSYRWGVRGGACVYSVGACVYGVGACVYGNPMVLVPAQVPLVLVLGLRVWGLGSTIFNRNIYFINFLITGKRGRT